MATGCFDDIQVITATQESRPELKRKGKLLITLPRLTRLCNLLNEKDKSRNIFVRIFNLSDIIISQDVIKMLV